MANVAMINDQMLNISGRVKRGDIIEYQGKQYIVDEASDGNAHTVHEATLADLHGGRKARLTVKVIGS